MKTPIQEAEEYILGILKESEVDMGTYGLIELKFREMSKKEKEVMSEIYAHDVSQHRELLKALYKKHDEETGYISMTLETAEGYLKSLL